MNLRTELLNATQRLGQIEARLRAFNTNLDLLHARMASMETAMDALEKLTEEALTNLAKKVR